MLQKLPHEVLKIILDFLLTNEPESFSMIQQISKQWKQHSDEKEPHWNDFLALIPYGKKSAKQIFFQNPSHRYPQFLSRIDRDVGQRLNNLILDLSGECAQTAKKFDDPSNEILVGGIEIFIKRKLYQAEILYLLTIPNTVLWNNLSLLDVINEDLLSLFVTYHPKSIPFLLLNKEEKILMHISDILLIQIIEGAPEYIPLILENPHPLVKSQILEHVKSLAEKWLPLKAMSPIL